MCHSTGGRYFPTSTTWPVGDARLAVPAADSPAATSQLVRSAMKSQSDSIAWRADPDGSGASRDRASSA